MNTAAVTWCCEHRGFDLCSTSHREKKRNMRHKINCHGQGLAIPYPVKIWAILGKGIKKALEEMGTGNRRRAESCINPFGPWHVKSQQGQKFQGCEISRFADNAE